jgi:hypothetical protein
MKADEWCERKYFAALRSEEVYEEFPYFGAQASRVIADGRSEDVGYVRW